MKEIEVYGGLLVQVDDEDYDKLNAYSWYAVGGKRQNVATTVTLYMHKLIMNPPEGMTVDHIDRNPLNCQRSNLRLATRSQNMMNRVMPENASGYVGVYANRNRWSAQIKLNKKIIYLGTFDTPEEAARERDKAAKVLHGAFAVLNFDEED